MRIAVNTRFLIKDQLEGYGYFVKEIFSRLVKEHPEHEFVFIFDREYDKQFVFAENVKPLVVSPKARHALSFKYWYDVKLPLALRSIKPDIVVQPYGFCSLTTNIPQLLVIHDLAFQHYPELIPAYHRHYYKLFTKNFLKKAKRVVTVSEFSKNDIIRHYKVDAEKIDVVYSAAKPIFQPLGYQEQQQVKDGYADSREYFLFTGGIHPRKNLMTLLKAFSLFKKWQKSNMKLLVAGRLAWQYDDLAEKIKTYKYREDVVLLGYLPEEQLAKVTASAYALVFPSFFEGFGVPVIEAMQCGVPVITGNVSSMPEVGGNAALYANPESPAEMAEQMKKIYKDELLRNQFIQAGKQQAAQFSWDRTAEIFWQNILKTVDRQ